MKGIETLRHGELVLTRCGVTQRMVREDANQGQRSVGVVGDFQIYPCDSYYMIVRGPMPCNTAALLWRTYGGEVRIAGNGGGVKAEDPWLHYFDSEAKPVLTMEAHDAYFAKILEDEDAGHTMRRIAEEALEKNSFAEDRSMFDAFVLMYHVDTEEGLRKLVEVIGTIPALREDCTDEFSRVCRAARDAAWTL